MDKNYFEQYLALRKSIDESAGKLESMHKNNMQCRKGCFSCCESISVFPIEFFTIKLEQEITELPKKRLKHKFGKSCRFLVDGACSIYNSRPIICRTQGLPLLYENSEGNGYELSVCTLNFKSVDISKFNENNALFMAPLNSRLYLLNKSYVENNESVKFNTFKRLKLNDL